MNILCMDKSCTLCESLRGVSVTVLAQIPRPQCLVALQHRNKSLTDESWLSKNIYYNLNSA